MEKKGIGDWASQKIFNFVHQNNLVYNTCWEDPRLDREALQLNDQDHLMMITSAGCNALDYVLDQPAHIYAVDVNPRQNALLELKKAAIRALDFERFFSLFGRGYLENFPELYRRQLREQLPEEARDFWDKKLSYFKGRGLRPSFYFHGTSGLFARVLYMYVNFRKLRDVLISMFAAGDVAQQHSIYHEQLRDAFWSQPLRKVIKRDSTLSLLGVPRPQRHQIDRCYPGGIAQFIEDCVESVFTKLPLWDNYFWWLYVTGNYTKERCPEYLKEENFNKLKAGLVDRVSTHTCAIADFMRGFEGQISKFVLLDHMDWLSTAHHPLLVDEWEQMIAKATKDARFLWRSGGLEVDFIDPITVPVNSGRERLGDLLNYNRELATSLHKRDRVHTYGSFYIADLALT